MEIYLNIETSKITSMNNTELRNNLSKAAFFKRDFGNSVYIFNHC